MRISFTGFDAPIDLADRGITILQVMNESLYARVCASLLSAKGEKAIEPYSIWGDDGCELNPVNAFIVVPDPFSLPWKHRSLMGGLYAKFESELHVDEELRHEIQQQGLELEASIHKLGLQLNADYRFGVEWNIGSYLKAFSYEIDISETSALLDNLISFIDLGADMAIDKVMVFMNLKTFLTKNDMIKIQERLFFHGMKALLLEGSSSQLYDDCEQKYMIDRDFVEYVFTGKSECLSSSQGGICSNGFGAVTF